MIKQSWQIGRIFGIPLRVHASWFLVFALIAWSLARDYFPAVIVGPSWEYWVLGSVSALLLFASVLVHELGHCLVALRYHIPISQITLFIFGGMAQIKREAPTPRAEFLIAIAGPVVSVLIALGFWTMAVLPGASDAAVAVSEHLRNINFIIAVFNLVPGYPLDGGRVLRAGLWAWSRNFRQATRYAARAGQAFAVLLMAIGLWDMSMGLAVGGMWFLLIGGFLFTAAQGSYRQAAFQESLAGLRVADVMTPEVVAVGADDTVDQVANQYFLRYGFEGFPVVDQGRMVGMVSRNEITAVPRKSWEDTRIRQIMTPRNAGSVIQPEESIEAAMDRMLQEDRARLLVMQDDKVLGIITRSGIGRFLDKLQK
jgi:Zn-dependent protease